MEVIIALGLGAWYVLAGVLASVAVFKDFKKQSNEEEKK